VGHFSEFKNIKQSIFISFIFILSWFWDGLRDSRFFPHWLDPCFCLPDIFFHFTKFFSLIGIPILVGYNLIFIIVNIRSMKIDQNKS